jgi:hypothetical protein
MRVHSPQFLAVGIVCSAFIVAALVVTVGAISTQRAGAATAITAVTIESGALTIDDIILSNGNNITLTEDDGAGNGFTFATATVKISGGDGCTGITSVTAKLYLASTSNDGTTCTTDDNSCYVPFSACAATTTGGATPQCTGGGDNDVWYDCGFKLWYLATPTETEPDNIWSVAATTTDTSPATTTATNSGELVDVFDLFALRTTPTITYGTVDAGSDTGAVNSTTTVTNTGNISIDTDISCETMCTDFPTCSGGTLGFSNQEASTLPFTWGVGGTDCTATTSPTTYVMALPKPTATTSAVTDDVSWGIAVPGGQSPAGDYTGENVFDAVGD